jgi:hypothetical protein
MNYKLSQIKEMAYIYRMSKGYTIRRAVVAAYEAYEIFRDAEFEVQIKSVGK